MSTFITSVDYTPRIQDARLSQIIQSDTTILDDAESTAIAIVKDALHSRYDVAAIFALAGAARPKQVVRWCVSLVLYFLYERVPDAVVPKRVIKNYDDTMAYLLEVEDGKKSVDLPRLENPDESPKTKFRGGSELRQEH